MDKIKWTGDNLRAIIGFIGGMYKKGFDEWFHGSWEEYEKYVHDMVMSSKFLTQTGL